MPRPMLRLILLCGLAMPLPGLAQTTVRWGVGAEVTTMDPQGAYTTVNSSLLGNIYEGLVRIDPGIEFEPCLATSWTVVAPDQWRFTIRQDVRFQDGTPLPPDDVVASIRRAGSPNSPFASVTHAIREVAATGGGQVDVFTRVPYPTLINDLAGISILSKL